MARAIPILFFREKCSLNKMTPKIVDKTTIPTLLMVNNIELSKPFVCKDFIKKMIEK
jgi:hypothetical protein